MKNIKLFCLPYAGGASTIYAKWKQHISKEIELCPIELRGRGRRFGEPLYNNVEEIVDDVYNLIKRDISTNEYAIFGHSLGSIVAYELAHKIQQNDDKLPKHIFFAGKKAPQFKDEDKEIHHLPDKEFIEEILEMGGTPKEILENKELLELVLPIVRADFKVNELYRYKQKEDKLDSNITIIKGKDEKMNLEEVTGWREHTDRNCKFFTLDGDHFFINDKYKDIISIISNTLL